MRMLVIEDDAELARVIAATLADAGHAVDVAADGTAGDSMLAMQAYDAVVLDINLPRMSGLDVLARARARGIEAPVLLLTARGALEDRVRGLDAGADDYLMKPFDLPELEARVRALLRRRTGAPARLVLGRIQIDTAQRRAYVDGKEAELPPREFTLLEALALQAGTVVPKAKLAEQLSAWDDDPLAPSALEVYVHRLRRKLGDAGRAIRTVRGMGYLLERPGA